MNEKPAQIVKSNNDDLIKNTLDMMRTNSEFLIRQFGESLRHRNLWIAQIITIASAILGGFLLSQQRENLVISLGLSLLFILIFVGLIFIYINNKNWTGRIIEAAGKSADYYIRCLIYFDLLNKQNLTEEQQKTKTEIEVYFGKLFKEIGVIKEDGTLGSIYEKLLQDTKIDWANYLLIIGFFLSGLILTFSDYIACYLGLGK